MFRLLQSTAFILLFSLNLIGCDKIFPAKPVLKPAPAEVAVPKDVDVPPSSAPAVNNALVRVGDWSLTLEQFNDRLSILKEGLPKFDITKLENKKAVLDELVRQQLLVKDAEDQGIGKQKDIVEAVEDFRRTLLVQEAANRLTKGVVATDKEAQAYYDANKKDFVDPPQWKAREIVVNDEATAKNILVQVLQGGDFGEIAKAQSKGKTAATGGMITAEDGSPMIFKAPFEAMQTAISTLDVGGISAVFKGPAGYYLVKVDEKKGGEAVPLAEVKAKLLEFLTNRKQQKIILDHLNELGKKTKVEIKEEFLGSPAGK